MNEQRMKPIWYFVGLMLLVMGFLVTTTGIVQYINPPETKTILGETHPNIWWGLIMVIFGDILYLKTRKKRA